MVKRPVFEEFLKGWAGVHVRQTGEVIDAREDKTWKGRESGDEGGNGPQYHQTDNSTAATHKLKKGGKRGFNEEYEVFMAHFGMIPRTTAVGQSNQNGDVEVLNGALKRRLHQRLLLRGNMDFESVAEYEAWIQEVTIQANKSREEQDRKRNAGNAPGACIETA